MKTLEFLKNGSGPVTFRTFYVTLAILCSAGISAAWAVYVQADPASRTEVQQTEQRVTTAVKEAEQRVQEDLAEQRIEQRVTDGKIDRILFLLIQQAGASTNETE
jgi:hypothetical protein